jgi:pimeloyl-ACP methyl ester carboxylesterase
MTPTTAPSRRRLPVQGADVLGLSRLGVDATVAIVDLVEAMHHTIASGAGIVGAGPAGRPSGITGGVYSAVRGTTRVVGKGLNALLGAVTGPARTAESTPGRETMLAVLNGVWGDHLAETGNPLAITSSLRIGGRALDLAQPLAEQVPAAGRRVVVLVHGLCMNDLQWRRNGHDHGQALARDLPATAVYFHYNSGRHVSENGRDLARLLDQLIAHWPVPVDELMIVGHSMGGLVVRSACQIAQDVGQGWLAALKKIVFLGTPHSGAPLERGGSLVDAALAFSPYVRPFARLGKARSAGITDLRYGNVQDADWHGRDRHAQRHDDRVPTPLSAGVDAFVVAATKGEKTSGLHSALVGDGLVPVASALGEHRQVALRLVVPKDRQQVVTQANHWDLLSRRDVYEQVRAWLT